jgi:hypothetical protein
MTESKRGVPALEDMTLPELLEEAASLLGQMGKAIESETERRGQVRG